MTEEKTTGQMERVHLRPLESEARPENRSLVLRLTGQVSAERKEAEEQTNSLKQQTLPHCKRSFKKVFY